MGSIDKYEEAKEQGKSTRDIFAEMFQKEQNKVSKEDIKKEKWEARKVEYELNAAKLEQIQSQTPDELYESYSFDTETRFFTDFMQSQMSSKLN